MCMIEMLKEMNEKLRKIESDIDDSFDGIDTITYKTDDIFDEIELIRTDLNEITETIDRLFKYIEETYTSIYMINKELKEDIYRITDELYDLKKRNKKNNSTIGDKKWK